MAGREPCRSSARYGEPTCWDHNEQTVRARGYDVTRWCQAERRDGVLCQRYVLVRPNPTPAENRDEAGVHAEGTGPEPAELDGYCDHHGPDRDEARRQERAARRDREARAKLLRAVDTVGGFVVLLDTLVQHGLVSWSRLVTLAGREGFRAEPSLPPSALEEALKPLIGSGLHAHAKEIALPRRSRPRAT